MTAPYPESTEGLAEFSIVFDGENNVIALDGQDDVYIYYNPEAVGNEHVVPLEVESLPFAYRQIDSGYDNPRYYRVKGTNDWIYSYCLYSRRDVTIELPCRKGAKIPSPEQTTQIFLSWGFPQPGEEIDSLFVTSDAVLVRAAVQAIESEGSPPDSFPRLRDICSLPAELSRAIHEASSRKSN